jgi:Fimbrial assembly protein (PilN)
MKITASFAPPTGRMAPWLAATSVLLALLLLAGTFWLAIAAAQLRAQRPALDEQLARLRNRELPTPAGMPTSGELATLREQVQRLNGLSGTVGPALPVLLARLEKLIPDGAWLVNMQYRAREGETRLLVEADQAELLTDFMERLEKSHYFSQVLLTRQAPRMEGGRRTIQFEIQLREQP